jgi:hypothetical protein
MSTSFSSHQMPTERNQGMPLAKLLLLLLLVPLLLTAALLPGAAMGPWQWFSCEGNAYTRL